MSPSIALILLANLALIVSTAVYGGRFLRRGNVLLGIEWWVVTVSAVHMLVYLLSESEIAYRVTFFLDAFSRAFGIPVIAALGLRVLTHGYRPSRRADLLWFAASFAGTALLVGLPVFATALPYFYLLMWTGFSLVLADFARRLWRAGLPGQTVSVTLALLAGQTIALRYDLYPIAGDEDQVVFFTLAMATWGFLAAALYHAYAALARVTRRAPG